MEKKYEHALKLAKDRYNDSTVTKKEKDFLQKMFPEELNERTRFDQLKSILLQYVQDAANRSDDSEIESDTEKYAKRIVEFFSEEEKCKHEPNEYHITPNKDFFRWIYDRLIYVHNENPNVDYMRSFKERIESESFMLSDEPCWRPSREQIRDMEHAISVLYDWCENVSAINAINTLNENLKDLAEKTM